MKYNIHINQKVLADTSLDMLDCAILDWIIAYCRSENVKIINKREGDMTWISYTQIIRDMPLLRIKTKGSLTPRIKKIEKEGYIRTELKHGGKMFIGLTEKVDELFFESVHATKRYRSSNSTDSVHETKHTITLKNYYTNTKKRVKKKSNKKLPYWLNKTVWNSWIVYRKEIRKPLKASTIKLQLKMLEKHKADHVTILETSIMNGWAGLFPPKNGNNVYKNQSGISIADKIKHKIQK